MTPLSAAKLEMSTSSFLLFLFLEQGGRVTRRGGLWKRKCEAVAAVSPIGFQPGMRSFHPPDFFYHATRKPQRHMRSIIAT